VLSQEFDFPIIGIIAPTAALVAREGLSDVGLFATEFTIASGGYERLIHALDPSVEVVGKGSPLLAELVDSGKFDKDAIDAEITRQIGNILSRAPVRHIILGCTHYPIVKTASGGFIPALNSSTPPLSRPAPSARILPKTAVCRQKKRERYLSLHPEAPRFCRHGVAAGHQEACCDRANIAQ
jgi:glutamate racemase